MQVQIHGTDCERDIEESLEDKEVAELIGMDELQIEEVEYNGLVYKRAVYTEIARNMGMEIPIPVTVLVRVDKGIIHTFQFLGSMNNEHYPEFEEVIRSVYYPDSIELLPERAFYIRLSGIIPYAIFGLAVMVVVFFIILKKKSG